MSYAWAIVYDLESENLRVFRGTDMFDKVRCARVTCATLLHSLGVQCTESVILVPPERASQIEAKIARVRQIYEQLNETLANNGFSIRLRPIIEVISLTQEQTSHLMPIAERRLLTSLDSAIDSVSRIIDELNNITEENRRRRIRVNLRRMANNWSRIFEVARQLGIDIQRDYHMLVELIVEALERCQ